MTDDEVPCLKAVTQQQESFFFAGMIRIVNQASVLVEENRLSFLKGDAMLSEVGSGLGLESKARVVLLRGLSNRQHPKCGDSQLFHPFPCSAAKRIGERVGCHRIYWPRKSSVVVPATRTFE
jgi:hypothetical protein